MILSDKFNLIIESAPLDFLGRGISKTQQKEWYFLVNQFKDELSELYSELSRKNNEIISSAKELEQTKKRHLAIYNAICERINKES